MPCERTSQVLWFCQCTSHFHTWVHVNTGSVCWKPLKPLPFFLKAPQRWCQTQLQQRKHLDAAIEGEICVAPRVPFCCLLISLGPHRPSPSPSTGCDSGPHRAQRLACAGSHCFCGLPAHPGRCSLAQPLARSQCEFWPTTTCKSSKLLCAQGEVKKKNKFLLFLCTAWRFAPSGGLRFFCQDTIHPCWSPRSIRVLGSKTLFFLPELNLSDSQFFVLFIYYEMSPSLFLAVTWGMWDLSSLTRDWTDALCHGSAES